MEVGNGERGFNKDRGTIEKFLNRVKQRLKSRNIKEQNEFLTVNEF